MAGVTWAKHGPIFRADGQYPWMAHHACPPVPDRIAEDRLRIYFAPRDEQGRSRAAFIDVDPAEPSTVHHVHDRPVLDLGKLGAFDDSGVMPTSIVDVDGAKYLYYIGWNRGVTVPYRNSVGLAVSTDGGVTFERAFDGPIVDRTREEPYFTASPFVLRDGDTFRMWYASGTGWLVVDDHPEPLYVIKHAESGDGIEWRRSNVTCIAPAHAEEVNARPWVMRGPDGYRMWYCHRGSRGYRHDPRTSYRIGYAESSDGIVWSRRDDEAGIDVSPDGWDSEMITYPSVYEHEGTLHLLYNGNGFGETGIGHAVAVG
jgi:hypothetical protein